MKLSHIAIKNFKVLLDTSSPLSDFVSVVGENNAGKSTLLQAILLFINGAKLSKSDYYDPGKDITDITITVTLSGVTDESLSSLSGEHLPRICAYVVDGSLTLARRYGTDGTSKLRIVTN